ncbi:MAG: SDR family oxidoreductase [Francisella endosymbiont of Hyalomma asiaticum]
MEVELKNDDECKELVNKVYNYLGSIDILINNAAGQFLKDNITDISAKQLKTTFETNFYHYVYMIKGAYIINSTSVTAYKGRPDNRLLIY